MITVKIEFEYEGEKRKFTACLKNDMTLCENKKNQAVEIVDYDDEWSLVFDFDEEVSYEVTMRCDEQGRKTFDARGVLIWGRGDNGLIDDAAAKATWRRS